MSETDPTDAELLWLAYVRGEQGLIGGASPRDILLEAMRYNHPNEAVRDALLWIMRELDDPEPELPLPAPVKAEPA
jgi:hypothetical protein